MAKKPAKAARARKRKSKPTATGTCFPDAVKIARELDDRASVVHGKVWQRLQEKWIHHAWVERDGMIYDSTFPAGVSAPLYKRLLKPKPTKRYDKWTALVSCIRTGHWGPW